MDHPFRSAPLGGFNKQDVLAFLEEQSKQAAQTQQQLQEQLEGANRQAETLRQEGEELRRRLEEAQRELETARQGRDSLNAQLEEAGRELAASREETEQARRELEQSRVQGSRLVRLLLRLRVLSPVKQLLLRLFLFFALLGLAAEETEQDRIFERHTFQHLLFFSGRLMGAMGKRSLLQLEAVLEPHAAVEDQVLRGTVPAVRAEVAHTHELEPIAGGGVLQARLQLAAGDHLQGIGVEAV